MNMGASLDSPQTVKAENGQVRTVLQDFVAQHLASNARNSSDAATDRQAITNDRGGNKTAQLIIALDQKMQHELASGKSISPSQIAESERLHVASRKYTGVDAKMDKEAIGQDPTDANGERASIKSDQNALNLKGLSPALKAAIQKDLGQKKGLLANETGDTSDESRYLRHDQSADQSGDRLAAALGSHNPAQIKAALKADIAAQAAKGADYREDAANERGYASADDLNTRQNAIIAQALKTDPYAQLTLKGR
jgi:hypothetical protein